MQDYVLLLLEDCLLKKGIFPFHCLRFICCMCRFCLIIFIPLPHIREVQFMVWFPLSLIIWGAGMSTELEEEIRFAINFVSRKVKVELWASVLFHPSCLGSCLVRQYATFFSLYDWGLLTLIFYSLLNKIWCLTYSKQMLKSFFLACFCFIFCLCVCDPWEASYLVLQHTWNHPLYKSDFWKLRLHWMWSQSSVPD